MRELKFIGTITKRKLFYFYQIYQILFINDNLEQALKSVFPKVDPRTVVSLILQERKVENLLYTLETILKPGQDTDAITVRAPMSKDKAEIQKIVLDKASWILKKQKEYREMTPEITKPSFKDNATFPYLGKNYPTELRKSQSKNSVEMADGKFLVHVKSLKTSRSHVERLYENFLMEKATAIFEDKVKESIQKD